MNCPFGHELACAMNCIFVHELPFGIKKDENNIKQNRQEKLDGFVFVRERL